MHSSNETIFLLALLVIVCALCWRAWTKREQRLEKEAGAEQRYRELKRDLATLGQALPINGSSEIVPLLGFMIVELLIVLLAITTRAAIPILMAVALMPLLVLATIMWLPSGGRPVLVLDRAGIRPAGYAALPWSSIHGIEFTELKGNRTLHRHLLRLYVPQLYDHMNGADLLVRILRAALRGRAHQHVITIRLRNTSELPHVIERLCRDLWKAATGRDRPWRADSRPDEMQLADELERLDERHKRNREISPEDAERELHELQGLARRLEAMQSRMHQQESWSSIWGTGIVALMMLAIASGVATATTNFVPSGSWSLWSAGVTAVVVCGGLALFVRYARSKLKGDLRGRRLWGTIGAMTLSGLLAFGWTHHLIASIPGEIVVRYHSTVETVTITATKKYSRRPRRCDERLTGAKLGNPVCLTREQYDSLPEEVPVTLTIRRGALGYHVDSTRIDTPAAPAQ